MIKSLYIHLIFIIHACILFRLIISHELFRAEDYRLEYYRNSGGEKFYWKHFFGTKLYHKEFITIEYHLTTSVILYKIFLTKDFLTGERYDSELRISIRNVVNDSEITPHLKPREYNIGNKKFSKNENFLTCNLFKCHIGLIYICPPDEKHCSHHSKGINLFYIGFEKSSEYNNLVLKLITKNNNNKYMFTVVVCPGKNWLPLYSSSEYIIAGGNYLTTLKFKDTQKDNIVRFVYCHEKGVSTFTMCGYLKQRFMPSINVGYQCDEYNKEETSRTHNKNEKETYMVSPSSDKLMCNHVNISDSSSLVIGVLPPGNNYGNVSAFKVNVINNKTNLYYGHRLHCLNIDDVYVHYELAENFLGYAINYEAKCKIPTLNATLSLKINGTVQEFENKTENNSGGMKIYAFDRRKIKDVPVGCHPVPDDMKHPALNDFYGLLYSTSLLMFDEASEKHIEVNNIQNLVSDRKYKCTLIIKGSNSKVEKLSYIKETEFIINLVGENSNNYIIWIIFAVFIIVIILLVAGVIILKKLQLKKKKSNEDLSTSSSTSPAQSKSSTQILKVVNTSILKKKVDVNTDMTKKVVTKNSNANNKLTNFKQKVVGKNSNINFAKQTENTPKKIVAKNSNLTFTNQAKNATKKVAEKNTNQKNVGNKGDSVFKLK
uniref:EGF-like domain-containing protein n=1 Tax=Strongyloides papillosus TaxID=174720 RepID=A0A0N5CGB4_STREA